MMKGLCDACGLKKTSLVKQCGGGRKLQPRPQGFSLKKCFEGKALGTRLRKLDIRDFKIQRRDGDENVT